MFCFYQTQNNNPLLILKPVKAEIIRLNPSAVIFHDLISDDEISLIKRLSFPELKRATVHNMQTGKLEFAKYRVQKSAWLNGNIQIVNTINTRIGAVTGLNLFHSEPLQIGNYGLGGQYEPHFDHSKRKDDKYVAEVGNRIATVLTYLTDVEEGGNTVFLVPKISVKPKKGSTLFWYNLKPSSQSDDSTRHAGCPVYKGHKWVSNKWFRDFGNEFTRPCYGNIDVESKININGWLGNKCDLNGLADF